VRLSKNFASGAVLAVSVLSLLRAGPAIADFKVFTPDANKGELSLETVGDAGFDRNPDVNGEQSYTAELEYGLTHWWQTELEFEFNRDPGVGQPLQFNQITTENTFQFTERGEYFVDLGFFAEYGQSLLKNTPNETTFGPLIRKDFWGTSTTVDLFLGKDLGEHASGRFEFSFAAESRFDFLTMQFGRHFAVEPGIQWYGTPGQLGHFANWSGQDQRLGPQLFGKIFNIGPGTLEFNGGVLFGLTPAVPTTTLRWQLEYEIHY
jgi:hypothetical protein